MQPSACHWLSSAAEMEAGLASKGPSNWKFAPHRLRTILELRQILGAPYRGANEQSEKSCLTCRNWLLCKVYYIDAGTGHHRNILIGL